MIAKKIIKDNIRIIKTYHEETKHHYHKFANAPGYMDWDSQPDPFRRFINADLIRLPLQREDKTPLYEDIFIPEKVEAHPLKSETIAKFLEYSLTISAWKQLGDVKWALRMNPSSGNLHPTEGYLILPEIEGINKLPGVYHYACPCKYYLSLNRQITFLEIRHIIENQRGKFEILSFLSSHFKNKIF